MRRNLSSADFGGFNGAVGVPRQSIRKRSACAAPPIWSKSVRFRPAIPCMLPPWASATDTGWGLSTITRLPLLDLGASRSFASPILPHRVQRRYRCF